ncbi:PREDICTED: keratinocyte-associated protein 3 isoform X2 [Miniopterus natalensis]|uniref:keratinocyte-associated protein 3 isoform X2 n=1 Tax=Miniopterus natalensis TaxID=291302 RepID=UPI0007A6B3C5|nr:PREDICTED: keratinocyte-associated protein 3 isoform X2 [Miniopterus natalensis]
MGRNWAASEGGPRPGRAAPRRARREAMRCCRFCRFDAVRGPRRLMRVGLALILVGHVNLLLGAVLHGTVLRHVANPRGAVTPEYTTANVISVGSGLLSVSLGLVALVASRNPLRPQLHWALLAVALVNLLLSTACSLGLLLAVSLTVANGGRRLIADCHPGLLDPLLPLDQGPGHADCPFDPTRIYLEELTELDHPKCKRQDNEQLLGQNQEIQASQKSWA